MKHTILVLVTVCTSLVMGCSSAESIQDSALNGETLVTVPMEETTEFSIDYDTVQMLFENDFWNRFDLDYMDKMCLGEAVVGNRYYYLAMSGNIYCYDSDEDNYECFTAVSVPQSGSSYQGKGYSDLDDADRQERDNAVFRNRSIIPCSRNSEPFSNVSCTRQQVVNTGVRVFCKAFRQDLEQIEHIVLKPERIRLSCFEQGINECAGLGSVRGVREQPTLAANDERADRIFYWIIAQFDFAVF